MPFRRMFLHALIILLDAVAAGILVYAILGFGAIYLLLHPMGVKSNFTPRTYNLPFKPVSFFSQDGTVKLQGWIMRHESMAKGLVLFCHGLQSNKSEMLPLAAFFFRNGFDSLVFDFRAHGDSEGFLANLGFKEAGDVLGALQYVRDMHLTPDGRVAVVAYSMGAAATLLAAAQSSAIQVLVCDSPFADGNELVKENFSALFHGLPQKYFWKFCRFFLDRICGFTKGMKMPVDAAAEIKDIPILLIHGEEDPIIPVHHTKKIFEHYGAGEKEIWLIPRAGHNEAFNLQPDLYQQRVLQFIEKHLGFNTSAATVAGKRQEDGYVEVAVGIVIEEGRVLVARRLKGQHLEGLWEFPGGKLNPEEPPQLAVIRELREETNLEVVVEKLIDTVDFSYPDRKVRIHFFKCRLLKGAAKPIKWGELRWINREELEKIQFPPANKSILPQIKQYLS